MSHNAALAMDYLKDAAQKRPDLVNSFVNKNDTHFGSSWPSLRQVMFADYSPEQFWKRMGTRFKVDTASFNHYWGNAFLGFSPVVSEVFFMVLTGLLVISGMRSQNIKKLKRLFECKYCGAIICRKCTTGILCPACSSKTSPSSNSTIPLDQLRGQLITTSRSIKELQISLYNLIFPGSGTLYKGFQGFAGALFSLLVFCFVYAGWFFILGKPFFGTATLQEKGLLLSPLFLFHILAILRTVPILLKQVNKLTNKTISSGVN
jgi:hypothetical protein